jgi:hypothetical protein
MPKDSVKLISKGGYEFIVDYKAACASNTLKSTLSSDGMLALTNKSYRVKPTYSSVHHLSQSLSSKSRSMMHGRGDNLEQKRISPAVVLLL